MLSAPHADAPCPFHTLTCRLCPSLYPHTLTRHARTHARPQVLPLSISFLGMVVTGLAALGDLNIPMFK